MLTENDLGQFNEYSIEWNERTITWKLNSVPSLSVNLEEVFSELEKMYMIIELGGDDNEYRSLYDLDDWDCPSLLVDYVLYYRWVNESIAEQVIKENSPSKDGICVALNGMEIKTSGVSNSRSKSYLLLIVITVLSVFLTIVLIIFLFLFSKNKKLRQNSIKRNEKTGSDVYDDIQEDNYYSITEMDDNYYCSIMSSSSTNKDYLEIDS